jgi:hypothetical protein
LFAQKATLKLIASDKNLPEWDISVIFGHQELSEVAHLFLEERVGKYVTSMIKR